MQPVIKKEIKTELAFQWLKIALGLFFIGLAIYRYIDNGYQWRNISIGVTIIFSIIIPAVSISKIIYLKKEARKEKEDSSWQEPEIL